jgi:hypothetical protein
MVRDTSPVPLLNRIYAVARNGWAPRSPGHLIRWRTALVAHRIGLGTLRKLVEDLSGNRRRQAQALLWRVPRRRDQAVCRGGRLAGRVRD